MPTTPISDVLEVSAKAAQLGPFLFAVLFNLVITLWAQRNLESASTRSSPVASEKELATYRLYFWLVATFGIILVIVSIVWWFRQQPAFHVYRGVIQDLMPHERIASDSLYFKKVLKPAPFDDDLRERNEHFLAIQDKPFTENDDFEISYGKGDDVSTRESKKFRVKFTTDPDPKFKIDYDKSTATSKLIQLRQSPKDAQNGEFTMLSSAFATSLGDLTPTEHKGIILVDQQNDETIENVFEVLRQEKIQVSHKIAAIDRLEADSSTRQFLEQSINDILVLLDLTRHTDRELAYKATRVAQHASVDALLVAALSSPDTQKRQKAEDILFRIERGRAEKILDELLSQKDVDHKKFRALRDEVKSGKKERLLIPTASSQGDRYYVKAEWVSGNEEMIACLSKVFNRRLISTRTLDQEKEIMSGRPMRYVYWYSKSWALTIADEIEQCGGKATFVGL